MTRFAIGYISNGKLRHTLHVPMHGSHVHIVHGYGIPGVVAWVSVENGWPEG